MIPLLSILTPADPLNPSLGLYKLELMPSLPSEYGTPPSIIGISLLEKYLNLIIKHERSLQTIFGNITIKILRNLLGQFQNKLLTPYNRNVGNLEEMII